MEKISIEKNISIYLDIITEEEADYLLNIAKNASEDDWAIYGKSLNDPVNPPAHNSWQNQILKIDLIPHLFEKHQKFLKNMHQKIHNSLKSEIPFDFFMDEHLVFFRFQENNYMNEHHDNSVGSDIKFGTALYLNDDFIGGETYYPNLNLESRPAARSLLLHPSNKIYRHGVRPVKNGIRYSMSSFIHKI